MATKKQRAAARKNIKRAQQTWKGMTHEQHARAQPQGAARKRSGTGGAGKFYHIEVRPAREFQTIRTQDVGRTGGLERRAGKRSSGSWATESWLVEKKNAHVTGTGKLVLDNPKERRSLKIRGPIEHVKGDVFSAKPRRNVPEREKPTAAQKRARGANIKKAQRARHRS